MIPLGRYVAAETTRSMRWITPILFFCLIEAVLAAAAGPVLPNYAASAAAMFFLGIWVSVLVCNSESAVQEDITIVTVGGRARVRIAKLAVAYAGCLLLSTLAVAIPATLPGADPTFDTIVAGTVAHGATVLFGVALGALFSRPIVERTAWAVLFGIGVGLADIVIPNGPPVRQLLVLLNETSPHHLVAQVLLIAFESAAISFVIVVASLRIMTART